MKMVKYNVLILRLFVYSTHHVQGDFVKFIIRFPKLLRCCFTRSGRTAKSGDWIYTRGFFCRIETEKESY